MARYLTPAKLCTLIITETYLRTRENPDFDAKILDLISNQLGITAAGNHTSHELPTISSFAPVLSSIPSDFPGRSHYDDFVRTVWQTADLDQLHKLFEHMSDLMNPENPEDRKITPASPLGHFIRRSNVEWTRLHFADSLALLRTYREFIAPTWDHWASKDPEAAKRYASRDTSGECVPSVVVSASAITTPMISTEDIELALSTSIHSLQKIGARVPPELKAKLHSWLSTQRVSPASQNLNHFMSFFEAWRAGQYTLALEELHRYFDYSIASRGAQNGNGGDGVKAYYQYALLHLSMLHADFERWEESLGAMEECIATARENQDTSCLNFALSWLLYLRQAHNLPEASSLRSLAALAGDGGSEQDELAFLKAKAKDGKHWSLVSSTLLEEAKLELRHGGISPKALEYIIQSAHLNVQHGTYSLMPAATIFQGAVYDRLGQTHTAARHYASIEVTLGEHCSLADQARAQCRLALGLAKDGAYNAAQEKLAELLTRVRGTLKLEQRVSTFARVIALLEAIRSEHFTTATHHLHLLLPHRSISNPELTSQINLLHIAYLTRQCRFPEAFTTINALIAASKGSPTATERAEVDLAQTLHLLTLKASVFAAAGRPEKGFSIAIRAANSAERAGLVVVLIEALAVLANILNALGEFGAAGEVVEAALPQALESGPPDLSARLFVTRTSACAGLANPAVTEDGQVRMKSLREGLRWAERGREIYERINDHGGQLDCLAMKSRLSSILEDGAGFNDAEAKYAQLVADHKDE